MNTPRDGRSKMEMIKKNPEVALFMAMAIVSIIVFAGVMINRHSRDKKPDDSKTSPFLDYMPDVPRPCPSDYRCGGTVRAQMRMERNLWRDLREGSKYALPETLGEDQVNVIATEAEPSSCMVARANAAREAPMDEGQYTPWTEFEAGFDERRAKKQGAMPGTASAKIAYSKPAA